MMFLPINWSSYGFELSQRLRAVRLMRGFSQEKLAELSGLSRNQISNLERNDNNNLTPGDPHLSKLYALARALEVPPVVLLPAATVLVESLCRSSHVLNVEISWPAPGSQAVRLSHAADDYDAVLRAQMEHELREETKKKGKADDTAEDTADGGTEDGTADGGTEDGTEGGGKENRKGNHKKAKSKHKAQPANPRSDDAKQEHGENRDQK